MVASCKRGRFIPTRVGNTAAACAGHGVKLVHPHACGEYIFAEVVCENDSGSSPRVWGILFPDGDMQPLPRFIPTRVGNTFAHGLTVLVRTVHPHACGEYRQCQHESSPDQGSSPRVWGILYYYRSQAARTRFIPTRVGNTHTTRYTDAHNMVHPHACGEYS